MVQLLDRKRFVNTLGAAGLGLGLLVGAGGAPSGMALEKEGALACQGDDARDVLVAGDQEALRVKAYNGFTRALADELGIDDPNEIDAAIRAAMMAEVDANARLSRDGAEQQKALIAAAAAPVGPAYRGFGG